MAASHIKQALVEDLKGIIVASDVAGRTSVAGDQKVGKILWGSYAVLQQRLKEELLSMLQTGYIEVQKGWRHMWSNILRHSNSLENRVREHILQWQDVISQESADHC